MTNKDSDSETVPNEYQEASMRFREASLECINKEGEVKFEIKNIVILLEKILLRLIIKI